MEYKKNKNILLNKHNMLGVISSVSEEEITFFLKFYLTSSKYILTN